jgi:hypothetical protein
MPPNPRLYFLRERYAQKGLMDKVRGFPNHSFPRIALNGELI